MRLPVIIALLALATSAAAQGSKADYDRAFQYGKITAGKVLNRSLKPHWATNSSSLCYQR